MMFFSRDDYKNRWSLFEFITLGFSVICTRLCYPHAKLICYPFYMRGKKSLVYGKGLNIGYNCRFDLLNPRKTTLIIGENCNMGDSCHIVAIDEVRIGDNFLAASKVFISDCSHGYYGNDETVSSPNQAPCERDLYSLPVHIGSNVWVGENVVILSGSKIGDGCIIGANSVVNCSIPPNSIAVGSPARVIKQYDEKQRKWVRIK